MTDINALYLLLLWVFFRFKCLGMFSYGTAHSAGPPHLILISLCYGLLICAVWWWVRVWFCQTCHVAPGVQIKPEAGQCSKKRWVSKTQRLRLEHWYTFQVGSMLECGQYTQCSCFLCSLYSLCWWIRPGSGIPHREEKQEAVECHSSDLENVYLSIIYIPLSLSNWALHQCAWLSYFPLCIVKKSSRGVASLTKH